MFTFSVSFEGTFCRLAQSSISCISALSSAESSILVMISCTLARRVPKMMDLFMTTHTSDRGDMGVAQTDVGDGGDRGGRVRRA